MAVSQEERDAMANLMRLMNGEQPSNTARVQNGSPYKSANLRETVSNGSEVSPIDDMKHILSRFNAASDGLVRDSAMDRELREAMVTEEIDGGARIGQWDIRMHEDGGRKFYSVKSVVDESLVIAELTLYEAAQGLVRILNEGGHVNSIKAMQILRSENEYAAALEDAIRFKQRIVTLPNDPRLSVFEDRYGEAKRRALQAKETVKRLVE